MNIESAVLPTWCGIRSFVGPVGRHPLSITDSFSDEGTNVKGQLDSFLVGSSSFFCVMVGFQLDESVLQLSQVMFMIAFHNFILNFC